MVQQKQHIALIGGGLAGSFLAARLLKAGHQVSLFDDRDPHSASRVAAGLYNVITGRLGAKTWMAETYLDYLKAFFQDPDFQVFSPFLHPSLIYRPFQDAAAYNKWSGRKDDPVYGPLFEMVETPLLPEVIHNDWGGILILPCGWLATGDLVLAMQQWLIRTWNMAYYPYRLPYAQISLGEKRIHHDGGTLTFDQLVFCEGFAAWENPFFPQIKVIPNKGELLLIEAPGLELDMVLSKKVYLIPQPEGRYLVGSTYLKQVTDPTPTSEGRDEIRGYLDKLLKLPYRVQDQGAGIRPTTPNRRPIVGTHARWPHVHIITGLGTKGVLQAPYWSALMAAKIAGESVSIPPEADVNRF